MKHHGQLPHSTPAPADRRHDEHRVIADAWLRSAIDGIRQMYLNEDARREVAKGIFCKRSIRHTLTVGPKLCARSIKAAAV
ncbi:hypothetical protein EFP18_11220 [Burkholderia glumae]|uniref:hypothetical protein n=2 Tax=Burkholderia glumae TaxID=337 RepID=UPI002151C018|nr:hypothetical protein [Burkholderia glumae]UVS84648.1 hypothetical protein EFP18_11220 [Burkholderia glumae]